MLYELCLAPDAQAPARARFEMKRILAFLPSEFLDDVLLLTTEVLTNSVRLSGTRRCRAILLELKVSEARVRVRVTDFGKGDHIEPKQPAPTDLDGRGLLLVAEMSDRWGVELAKATSVWFELDMVASEAHAV